MNHLVQNHFSAAEILSTAFRAEPMATPITAKTTTAILNQPRTGSPDTETAAQLLERERDPLIHDWFALVQKTRRPDRHSNELRRSHCAFAAVARGCDCPAAPGLLDQSCYLHRCR